MRVAAVVIGNLKLQLLLQQQMTQTDYFSVGNIHILTGSIAQLGQRSHDEDFYLGHDLDQLR